MKYILITLIIFLKSSIAMDNLQTCLSGKYPSLCDYSQLTEQQKRMTQKAERRENLYTCLSGKYPSLCKHSLLSSKELKKVKEAERIENLQTCLSGKYKSLCKHHLLSSNEKKQVKKAEEYENLRICLNGRYKSICNYNLLTPSQKIQVKTAESNIKKTSYKNIQIEKRIASTTNTCEDGHWIQSVTQGGEIVILEDGSVWEISSIGQIDTSLWLPITNIVACPYQLINTDDGEKVDAIRIK